MPIRPRKITGSRCASRDDGLGKGDSSRRLAAETKLSPPPCSNGNPRHPNTLAKSPAQCEIFMQKDVCGPGRGALQSPCAPQPWPSGRGTRAGACAQACLVDMSASTVPLHLLLKLRVMLRPCRQNARTVIELSLWPEVKAARSTAARKFAPYRSNRQTKSIRRHLCEMLPRSLSPRVGQRRLFDLCTKPGPSSTFGAKFT
jgi:hypothetical protein